MNEARTNWQYGGIGRGPFMAGAVAIYLAGAAGQFLTAPPVLAYAGLWPFLTLQILLLGVWYALHAQKLRDGGRGIVAVQGIAVIHGLAIMLLVIVGVFYLENTTAAGWTPESLLLVRQLVTFSRGAGDLPTHLGLVACAVLLIPPIFSVWAARQPESRA